MLKPKDIKTEVRESIIFKTDKGKPEKFYSLVLPSGRKFELIQNGRYFHLDWTSLSEDERIKTELCAKDSTITQLKQKIAEYVNQGIISYDKKR